MGKTFKFTKLTNRSTFHYGSIKIDKAKDLDIFINSSTFHYGSIKIT